MTFTTLSSTMSPMKPETEKLLNAALRARTVSTVKSSLPQWIKNTVELSKDYESPQDIALLEKLFRQQNHKELHLLVSGPSAYYTKTRNLIDDEHPVIAGITNMYHYYLRDQLNDVSLYFGADSSPVLSRIVEICSEDLKTPMVLSTTVDKNFNEFVPSCDRYYYQPFFQGTEGLANHVINDVFIAINPLVTSYIVQAGSVGNAMILFAHWIKCILGIEYLVCLHGFDYGSATAARDHLDLPKIYPPKDDLTVEYEHPVTKRVFRTNYPALSYAVNTLIILINNGTTVRFESPEQSILGAFDINSIMLEDDEQQRSRDLVSVLETFTESLPEEYFGEKQDSDEEQERRELCASDEVNSLRDRTFVP